MFTLHDRFLSASVLQLVLFLIFFDERQKVKRPLPDEYYLIILDTTILTVFVLHDATLPNAHRFKRVVSSNVYFPLTTSLKRHDSIVIESASELNSVGVAAMRQVSRFVECLMPLILLALRLIVTTVCLADHLHAREDFPWREQQFLEHFRITLLVVIGDGCVVQ